MYLFNAYAGAPTGRRLRRRLIGGALTALAVSVVPAVAYADTATQLTVVGTSDVSDSGLMQNLIAPEFENAYPQFTFKYVGSATGAAIQSAEGTGTTAGPSVLLVHAASLENQFVGGGFSYDNAPGYAVFRNDFILAGFNGDPAGVESNAPNNIAQSFADVAAAGVAGRGTFISRGGTTTASGTTVEEHTVWGLVSSSGLTPAGVVLCDVAAADGGGMSPISPTLQATSGQACPDSGSVSSTHAPKWYVVNTGATQAANVEAANACTVGNANSTCYVLTDRGTYDYLSADQLAGGASLIPNLGIDVRNNLATAPGAANALINYFHAYIINPSKAGETVDLTAAQDFIDFLTSPLLQSQLANYLKDTGDVSGAPFVADASPIITATGWAKSVKAGASTTVSGTVTNAELGYPTLAPTKVSVDAVIGDLDVPLPGATAETSSTGTYKITFVPPITGEYQVVTGVITQLEDATLFPEYSDTLSPGGSTPMAIRVPNASAGLTKVSISRGELTATGSLSQVAGIKGTKVALLASQTATLKPGLKAPDHAFKTVARTTVKYGKVAFTLRAKLTPGYRYVLQIGYIGAAGTSYSKTRNLNVS